MIRSPEKSNIIIKLAISLLAGALVPYQVYGATPSDTIAASATIELKGSSDNHISLPYVRESIYDGNILSVDGATLTLSGASFSSGGLVYSQGNQPTTYYIQIKSGYQKGHFSTVISNGTGSVGTEFPISVLNGLAVGDQVVIRPYWTLGALFPAGDAGISFEASTSNFISGRKTLVFFYDNASAGINKAVNRTYYFYQYWRQAGDSGADQSDVVIKPDAYLIVRGSNYSNSTYLTLRGLVPQHTQVVPLRSFASTSNDNLVPILTPTPATLANLNLIPDHFVSSTSTLANGRKDNALGFRRAALAINKAASEIYFHYQFWRKAGEVEVDQANTSLEFAGGLQIRKGIASADTVDYWSVPYTYAKFDTGAPLSITPSPTGSIITWQSSATVYYKVEGSSDLNNWSELSLIQGNGYPLTHVAPNSSALKFFRVTGDLEFNLAHQINTRIAGKSASTAKAIFSTKNSTNGIYVRNPLLWCGDLDLTGVSPYNSSNGNMLGITAITPRHVIMCAHANLGQGTVVHFVQQDGSLVTRSIIAARDLPRYFGAAKNDIAVGLLNADLPPSIKCYPLMSPAAIDMLPKKFTATAFPDGYPTNPELKLSFPVLGIDQDENALVLSAKSVALFYDWMTLAYRPPTDPALSAFYEELVAGDSGHPAFAILNDSLALVSVWGTGYNEPAGSYVGSYVSEINQLISDLDTQSNVSTGHRVAVANVDAGYVWPANYRPEATPSIPSISYGPYYVNWYSPLGTDGAYILPSGPIAETPDAFTLIYGGGGIAPFRYKWEKVSGDDISPVSPNSNATKFTGIVPLGEERSAIFRCRMSSYDLEPEYDFVTPPITITLYGEVWW